MMAKLPKIEVRARWARDELNKGKAHREKALTFLADAGDGPLARELREAVKKRGRQPFGAKYRWWDIGIDNDEMRAGGMSYAERMQALALKYHLNDEAKLKIAIARYEVAINEIRAIEERNW